MSLLRIRRERKAELGGPRPPRLARLLVGLVLVVVLIWYLSRLG